MKHHAFSSRHLFVAIFFLLFQPLICFTHADQPVDHLARQPWKADGESASLQRNWDALRERHLRLLPVPKEIAFSEPPIVLSGKGKQQVVIVLEKDTPRGQVAVNEIRSRMRDFSSKYAIEIPLSPKKVPGAYNIVIENHWPGTFAQDKSRHPEAQKTDQAYGLYPQDDGVILSGAGEIGMMYAAVTCRFLMEEQEERVVLHSAKVIDWPDFKGRQLGQMVAPYQRFRTSPEKHLEKMKPFMDWMFRIKGNGVFRHTIGAVPFSTLPDTLPAKTAAMKAAKLVNQYAGLRGIKTMHNASVRLGTVEDDKERLGGENLMLDPRGDYHSWARHDLHRVKAQNMVHLFENSGISSAFVHAIDSGGILDPEDWSQRDEETRKRYGDDRVQADADMYNIYSKYFQQRGQQLVLVVYPYTADNLNVDRVLDKLGMGDSPATRARVKELIDALKQWMQGINNKTDKSVLICVREDTRANLFDYYSAYPGRPMWIYWETTHYLKGIDTIIAPPVRSLASAFSRDRPHTDVAWISLPKHPWFYEQILCSGAEFLWNTRFPGWHDFDPAYRDSGEVEIDDQQALDIVAERAAVSLWGDEAGQILKHTFNGHLSWNVAIDPVQETSGLNPSVLGNLTKKNKRAIDQACLAFEATWKLYQSKKSKGLKLFDDHSKPFFIQHYVMARGAKGYADMHAYHHLATQLISSGETDQALKVIDRGIAEVAKDESDYKKTMRWLDQETWVYPKHAIHPMPYHPELYDPDFDALKSKLEHLKRDRQKIYERLNIPVWFRPWFKKRGIVIAKTNRKIKIDGVPDEKPWRDAPPVSYFVGHQSFNLIREPTAVRWLHDDQALFVSGHVYNPRVQAIKKKISSRSKSRFDESIGIFIHPASDRSDTDGAVHQYLLGCAGDLAARKSSPSSRAMLSGNDPGKFRSKATAKVVVSKEGWTFELKIPLSELGGAISPHWKASVARRFSNGKGAPQNYASQEFSGAPLSDHASFAKVQWGSPQTDVKPPAPTLSCSKSSMTTKTTASGQGTQVQFGVGISTTVPIRNVTLETTIHSSEKNQVYSKKTFHLRSVNLLWKSPGMVTIQLENVHKGLKVKQRMTYHHLGHSPAETVETEVIFGDRSAFFDEASTFGEGRGRGNSLKSIARLDTASPGKQWLQPQQGTIEFWFKPQEDVLRSDASEEKMLFHYGPVSKTIPSFIAKNCVTAGLVKNVYLTFSISNHEYQYRKIQVRLPKWKKNTWHHLAFVWDMQRDGKSMMKVFMDGKLGDGTLLGSQDGKSIPNDSALETVETTFSLQMGCLNSGIYPINASFDDLILRNDLHYLQDFDPQAESKMKLEEHRLRFPFDRNLDGHYLDQGKKHTTSGQPGY